MKAIIFDCDGTLVDSEMTHFMGWNHALKKHGFDFSVEEYYQCVGTPIDKTASALARRFGKDCAEELRKDKHAYFQAHIQHGVDPIHETLEFLHRLVREQKRHKYKLAIASGASLEEIILYLRHLKIDQLFDIILSGKDDLKDYHDPEGINKPKPYIYLEAAKRLGVDPSECVAIEDSRTGVLASFKAGCVTVAIPSAFSLEHDFSEADLVISSFKDYTVDRFLKEADHYKNLKVRS